VSERFICSDCHQVFFEDLDDDCQAMIRKQAAYARRTYATHLRFLQDTRGGSTRQGNCSRARLAVFAVPSEIGFTSAQPVVRFVAPRRLGNVRNLAWTRPV
jgi:hypothetical protein